MATIAEGAPSTRKPPLQMRWRGFARARRAIEAWLEAERDQLPLWLPVCLGIGIVLWFVLPAPDRWIAAMAGCAALALAALAIARFDRASMAIAVGATMLAAGLGIAWARATWVASPVLARPAIVTMSARVETIETLPAREMVRLRLTPIAVIPSGERRGGVGRSEPPTLPPHVRINLKQAEAPAGLGEGAVIRLQARLMPPNAAAVPGAYDFARVAWFQGLGATGRGIVPVTVLRPGAVEGGLRRRLTAHIEAMLPGSAGGIAAALVTGDEGAITERDADAMRRSGLAHLLSVSGLHITAVVAGAIFAISRLLALWPWLALRARIPMIAAGGGALAAIGYTWLTGGQVPTMRSCIAALLVLAAMALGRQAITLRLVAAGAFFVLLAWPEAVMGPSFQLSFAAVAAIVALHEHPRVAGWFEKRDEGWPRKVGREIASLLLTGMVVEVALAPIALFHFHKSGLFGAFANIFAIPLTTFVIMPAEALALTADMLGVGAPFWWITARALDLLLGIAHHAAGPPGALAMLPAMPTPAYALMVLGGMWVALWRTRIRFLGLGSFAIGALWALLSPAPDLLVTGDGQHVAIRMADGRVAVLRDRTGDYARGVLAENMGMDGDPALLSETGEGRCSADACIATTVVAGRQWRILATRSAYQVPIAQLVAACRAVDIVVSDRRLPRTCTPRWLRLDKPVLRRTGGLAIALSTGRIVTVRQPGDRHPWIVSRSGAATRPAGPARAPAAARNAADHRRDWPDRAEPSRPRAGNI